MGTSLEKAQQDYEGLLIQLGEKALMVGMLTSADSLVQRKLRKAQESIADRRLELELLVSEVSRMKNDTQTEKQLDDRRAKIEQTKKILDVKKDKLNPLRSKVAGAEYDLKFVERGLEEEQQKAQELRSREEIRKAQTHEENIKRMKIEVMKRRKAISSLKQEIRELELTIRKLSAEIETLGNQAEEIEEHGGAAERGLVLELERQRTHKEGELERVEALIKEALADLGENLYNKRIRHPVLDKYYADLDSIGQVVDQLQR